MTTQARRIAARGVRDFVLFLFGAAIVWHEVFVVDQAEPWVLAVGAAFCVSPGTIHLDRILRRVLDDVDSAERESVGKGSQ
jgi:hypothetical protein